MDNTFSILAYLIKHRRSTKPDRMNGKKIPDTQINALLELADWAPTHGLTEPWRFLVYTHPPAFCRQHAEMYKQSIPDTDFVEAVYNKLYHQGDTASHVIIATMKRGNLPKIPVIKEVEAVACAVQNILIGATSLNIASFWSSGGMALKPAMHNFLELGLEDQVIGVIYLGYSNEHTVGKRTISLDEKVKWVK